MKIKEINYLVPPKDPINDCLDVFIVLEDAYCNEEFSYIVEITTPEYLSVIMKKSESNFVPPDYPCIIVSKLTDDIIKESIESFIEDRDDSYWLKLYHITTALKIEDVNEILYQKKQEMIELDAEIDAELNIND